MNEETPAKSLMPVQRRITILLGALMCAGLFLQHTVILGSWYTKTTFSDLVLPIIIVAIAIKIKRENIKISSWGTKILSIASFISIWLLVACINGYIETKIILSWAWGSKMIGFFILIAYMCTGAVLCMDKSAEKIALKTYVYSSYFVAVASYTRFLWEINITSDANSIAYRPIGFSENPNALAFILGSALIIQIAGSNESTIKSKWVNLTGAGFTLATIMLTGSRSTYLGLMFAVPLIVIYIRDIKWKMLITSGIIASLLIFNCSFDYSHIAKILNNKAVTVSVAEKNNSDWENLKLQYAKRNPIVIDTGVAHRWEMTKIGLDIWSKNPIMGSGLGSFLIEYTKKTGMSSVLHTSIIWLAVETGIIGLFAFATLIGLIIKRAWTQSRRHNGWEYKIVLLIIAYSLGASFGTEIIYQRQIWFIIGMLMSNDLITPSKIHSHNI